MPNPCGLSPRNHRLPLAVMGGQGALVIHCPRRSHFSLEVRLNSSNGLLFYVAGERGTSMALFVSNGRFIFLVDIGGRRLRIRSKEKYHDRRWHTVSRALELSRASQSHLALPSGFPCYTNPPALAPIFCPCRSSSAETRAEPSWSSMGCEPRVLQWPPQSSL